MQNNDLILEKYIVHRDSKLGSGSSGTVYLASCNRDMYRYAAKLVQKTPDTEREIASLKKLSDDSQHVVQYFDKFQVEDNYYIIMEYCDRSLADILKTNSNILSEPLLQYYFLQIITGIQEIQNKGITHRDLKIENIFLKDNRIKIGDFGFSTEQKEFKSVVGSPYSMPPESVSRYIAQSENSLYPSETTFNNSVDLWACGIMLYRMAYGEYPMKLSKVTNNQNDTLNQANKFFSTYNEESLHMNKKISLSKELKDLITGMLRRDSSKRMTLKNILQHEWTTHGLLRFAKELPSLQNYFNYVCSSFPSQIMGSKFDIPYRKQKEIIETYSSIKNYLSKKLGRFAFLNEMLYLSRKLLTNFYLYAGIARFRDEKDNFVLLAVFHLLIFQRQICYLHSHNRYLEDYAFLCIKTGRREEIIKEIVNNKCKSEFEGAKNDVERILANVQQKYVEDLQNIKKVFEMKMSLSDRKVVLVDLMKIKKIDDEFESYGKKILENFSSASFLNTFQAISEDVKMLLVFVYTFNKNRRGKLTNELLIEIEANQDWKNEKFSKKTINKDENGQNSMEVKSMIGSREKKMIFIGLCFCVLLIGILLKMK